MHQLYGVLVFTSPKLSNFNLSHSQLLCISMACSEPGAVDTTGSGKCTPCEGKEPLKVYSSLELEKV